MMSRIGSNFSFTLLELLVVILIISIALGFLTPLFRKTFLDIQLNSSAQDIVSLMRYAQQRAIIENVSFRLNLDTENGSYWLTMEESDKQSYSKLRGNFGRLYTIAGELKMEARESSVDFYPDGEAGDVRIKITSPNNKGLIITLKSEAGSNIVVRDENEKGVSFN